MIKLYAKLFLILLFSFALGGCKLDAPVYPEGTVPNPGATGGGATGGTSNGSSITYTLDGQTITLKTAFFQVISPSLLPPDGSTQIGGGTDVATSFSLIAKTVSKGTFDADVMSVGTSFGQGTVTFTELNVDNSGFKGTIKGTFTGSVISLDDPTEKPVSGSFSIKI